VTGWLRRWWRRLRRRPDVDEQATIREAEQQLENGWREPHRVEILKRR
jgi:hypothetical protein